tara:strand:+ start:965 stop:1897 length:933 start_codon:yes stop_codon:yes gene_type:complete
VNNPFGFLIVDKPSGMTSHDCVNTIRRIYKIKRVGHGGTLDPSVTGVLPIAIGNATRLFQYMPKEKTYKAIIQLGKETFTDDNNGDVIREQQWPILEKSFLESILNDFRGDIQQQPPMISSVHYQGERAYKKARKGEKFDLPMRKITIYNLQISSWNQKTGQLKLKIHCSSGTYIRALARDLGRKLNCGGCLLELRRIQSQGFEEKKAISLPKIDNELYSTPALINPRDALKHLQKIQLRSQEELDYWRRGRLITISEELSENLKFSDKTPPDNIENHIVVLDSNNELAGIGKLFTPLSVQPKVVFNAYS